MLWQLAAGPVSLLGPGRDPRPAAYVLISRPKPHRRLALAKRNKSRRGRSPKSQVRVDLGDPVNARADNLGGRTPAAGVRIYAYIGACRPESSGRLRSRMYSTATT